MFTGIIETRGRVVASEARTFGRRLTIDAGEWRGRSGRLEAGESIAINGVCLTIAELAGAHLYFDVIAETLNRSTLGDLQAGDAVNLESAMLASTPIGGHFVQGHVDGIGYIREVRGAGGTEPWAIVVQPPSDLLDCLTPKGSVAIEGVSLTIAAAGDECFEVALIPTTLEQTTLGQRKVGDRVNLESDMVARTVVHWLRRQGGDSKASAVSWRTLRAAGFLDESS